MGAAGFDVVLLPSVYVVLLAATVSLEARARDWRPRHRLCHGLDIALRLPPPAPLPKRVKTEAPSSLLQELMAAQQ